MNNDTETFTCRDCGESYPRSGFGKAKVRNTRCVGANTNGCDSKYRKVKRDAKRAAVPRAEVSMANLIAEMSQPMPRKRYLLDHLSADEKAERDRMRNHISKIIEKAPDYLRELGELEVVKQVVDKYPRVNIHAYLREVLTGNGWGTRKRHFTPELDVAGWPGWRRRYQWLLERTEWLTEELIGRAMKNEQNRALNPWDDDTSWLPIEKQKELERYCGILWHQFLVSRRFRMTEKAKTIPTPEELAREWVIMNTDEALAPYDAKIYHAMSLAHTCEVHYRAAQGRRKGTHAAKRKSDRADGNIAGEYLDSIRKAELDRIHARSRLNTPIGTWAEELPERYSPEAIDELCTTHQTYITVKEQRRMDKAVLDSLDQRYILVEPGRLAGLEEWAKTVTEKIAVWDAEREELRAAAAKKAQEPPRPVRQIQRRGK